jgi:hypothetical protein
MHVATIVAVLVCISLYAYGQQPVAYAVKDVSTEITLVEGGYRDDVCVTSVKENIEIAFATPLPRKSQRIKLFIPLRMANNYDSSNTLRVFNAKLGIRSSEYQMKKGTITQGDPIVLEVYFTPKSVGSYPLFLQLVYYIRGNLHANVAQGVNTLKWSQGFTTPANHSTIQINFPASWTFQLSKITATPKENVMTESSSLVIFEARNKIQDVEVDFPMMVSQCGPFSISNFLSGHPNMIFFVGSTLSFFLFLSCIGTFVFIFYFFVMDTVNYNTEGYRAILDQSQEANRSMQYQPS